MYKSPFVFQDSSFPGRLAFDGCDTRKDLSFDGLEQGAATGGNV